jgi:DNA repair exonuclease SbcCD nuclease subunit
VVALTVKIVITGDNHLNYYSQKFGSKIEQRRAQIGRAWRETVDFAIAHEADIYLNVGDMFDQVSPRNPPRCRVVEAFYELKEAGVRSFAIAGTHDAPASTRDGTSPHGVLQEAGLATVFEDPTTFKQETFEIEGRKISIAGISTDRRLLPGMDPIQGMKIPAGGDYNIAMLHYSVEKIAPPYWEEPQIKLNMIDENQQINLFAMGHIHEYIQKRVGDSIILYPGATERVSFRDAGKETGFCYLEVDSETRVEYIRTQSQPMSRINIHSSRISKEAATQDILDRVKQESSQESLMQLVLEGDIPFRDYMKIDFAQIFDEGRGLNFFFEYLDGLKPLIDEIQFESTQGLQPKRELINMADRYVENADPEEIASWDRARNLAISYYDRFQED